MSTREERVLVFEDTMAWIRKDPELSMAVEEGTEKSRVFLEEDYPAFEKERFPKTEVSVTKDRSFQAAMRLSKENPDAKIAVMNFANAFCPGGGVEKGASAQEECLCRTSTLYPVLNSRKLREAYYNHHKKMNTPMATDALIYTEDVVIVKTDEDLPVRMQKEDWVKVDVITIAAPDLRAQSNRYFNLVDGGLKMEEQELFACHVRRAKHMLTCAAAMGAEILVLGAFGCGAFENDPKVVAKAFKTALVDFSGTFKIVEFAVFCPPWSDGENYKAFKVILG